jgi:hypothetical protein
MHEPATQTALASDLEAFVAREALEACVRELGS